MAEALERAHAGLKVELFVVQTTGDKVLDSPLSRIGGKGLFTKEIEEALLDGRADFAVHSLKDLPTTNPPGLALAAVTERESPADVIVSAKPLSIDALPHGLRIGTSSLRRRAQLLNLQPQLEVEELRGNVPTRIQRALSGELDAVVLARAGIERLGLTPPFMADLAAMLPAPAQGSLGIQSREDDHRTRDLLRVLHHAPSAAACHAERALLQGLGGGCQIPLGALAIAEGDQLLLRALVLSLDGRESVGGELRGSIAEPEALGRSLAQLLLARGADRLLAVIGLLPPEQGFAEAVAKAHVLASGPLGGARLLVTRDEDADGPLSLALRALGADPIVVPLVHHAPPEEEAPLRAALLRLAAGEYQWLVLTSSRAWEPIAHHFAEWKLPLAKVLRARVACVGGATAAPIEAATGAPVILPPEATAASLLATLMAELKPGDRILYPRSERAADTLAEGLRSAGAALDDPIAYRTLPSPADPARALNRALAQGLDTVIFCSPSAVEEWVRLAPGQVPSCVASIGPRTSAALHAAGLPVHVEAPGNRTFEILAHLLAERLSTRG
jgi:hydroxymethylbilane synthase